MHRNTKPREGGSAPPSDAKPEPFFRNLNPWLRFIQVIGWLGAIGTLLAIWNFTVSVGTAGRWWWAKAHDTLILLACLLSVWIVWYVHLLSFSLKY